MLCACVRVCVCVYVCVCVREIDIERKEKIDERLGTKWTKKETRVLVGLITKSRVTICSYHSSVLCFFFFFFNVATLHR